MEQRGLAALTIDRRLATVCGYYRFAHIDGRIPSNPAQYVRRPKVQPSEGHGMDRGELGTFLFTAERFDHSHAALAVLLGLKACACRRRAGPTSRILASNEGTARYGSSARATSQPSSLWCRGLPVRSTSPWVNATKAPSSAATTASASTAAPLIDGCDPSASEPGWAPCTHICCVPGSSWRPWTRGTLYAMCRSPLVTPIPAQRPSMTAVERTSTATQRTS